MGRGYRIVDKIWYRTKCKTQCPNVDECRDRKYRYIKQQRPAPIRYSVGACNGINCGKQDSRFAAKQKYGQEYKSVGNRDVALNSRNLNCDAGRKNQCHQCKYKIAVRK